MGAMMAVVRGLQEGRVPFDWDDCVGKLNLVFKVQRLRAEVPQRQQLG